MGTMKIPGNIVRMMNEKDLKDKWKWMINYCEKHRLSYGSGLYWDEAERKWNDLQKQIEEERKRTEFQTKIDRNSSLQGHFKMDYFKQNETNHKRSIEGMMDEWVKLVKQSEEQNNSNDMENKQTVLFNGKQTQILSRKQEISILVRDIKIKMFDNREDTHKLIECGKLLEGYMLELEEIENVEADLGNRCNIERTVRNNYGYRFTL